MLSLKAFHQKEVKRVAFKNEWLEFEQLLEQLSKMFGVQASWISWLDESGDDIKVTSSEELEEAVRIMRDKGVLTFQMHTADGLSKKKRKIMNENKALCTVSPDGVVNLGEETPQSQPQPEKRKQVKLQPPGQKNSLSSSASSSEPSNRIMDASPVASFSDRMMYPDVQAYRDQQEKISWHDLKRIYNWYWFPGSGLFAFYYVRPGDNGERFKSKKDMLANGQRDKDYFLSEMDAVNYFLENYSDLMEQNRLAEASEKSDL